MQPTYKLFLDLNAFWAAASNAGAEVALQDMMRDVAAPGMPIPNIESFICLTALATRQGHVLAARVVLERTEIWQDERAVRGSVQARAAQALTFLRAAADAHDVPLAPQGGIVAVPGLLDDLLKIRTTHALWHYATPDRHDPRTWRLIAPAEAAPSEEA
jgi:hypothetical protein